MVITKIKLKRCSHCKKPIPVGDMMQAGLSTIHRDCLDEFVESKIKKVKKKKLTLKKSLEKSKKDATKAKAKTWAWEVFSKYIRQRDSDKYGYCYCISCNKRIKAFNGNRGAQAGHFIPKSKGDYFYFNEDNVHAQCKICNEYGSHDTGANYRKNLVKKIGLERVEKLEKSKNKIVRYTLEDYRAISKKYNKLFKQLRDEE